MRAYVINQFGDTSVFQQAEVAKPELQPGYALIRVAATSVNPTDYYVRGGGIPDLSPDFPAILHGDVAGVVEAIGENVTNLAPGDEVYGLAGGLKGHRGALAEYMLVDANLVAKKPSSLTMAEAAALPLVALTAWEGLIDRVRLQPGQKVLVYGGTGGVGHVSVQLAKWAGAKVYTTVSSPEKAAIAQQLGADVVINYREQSVEEYVAQHTDGKGFDVVVDTIGNDHLQTAFQAAALNGTVFSLLTFSKQDLTLLHLKGLTLHVVFVLIPILNGVGRVRQGEFLSKLAGLVDSGALRPLIDSKYTFAQVAEAHQRAESGQAIGKVVLTQSW